MKRSIPFFILLVAADQLTKHYAHKLISPAEPVKVLPFFQLVNVRNVGAAFGVFQSWGNTFFVVVSIVAVVIITFLLMAERKKSIALTLVISGAVGNLADRLFLGYVRDFLDFFAGGFHWPAFNLADSYLTIGIGLLLLQYLRPKKTSR